MFGAVLNRLATSVRRALSKYAVGTQEPELAFDFIDNKYTTNNSTSNFASAITHSRSGNAVMTDGYGPELVVNGGFDSDLSGFTSESFDDATWSNGTALISRGASGNGSAIYQGGAVVGKVYEVSFDISNLTGSILVNEQETYTTGGRKTFIYEANSTWLFRARCYVSSSANIDNVSVREMPVLKWAPHNLCRNSEDATESNFFKSNVTVTSVSSVTAPNGTTGVNKYEFAGAAGDNVYITDGGADIRGGVTGTFAVFAKAVSSATTIRMRIWDNGSTGAQYVDKSVSADDWTLLTHEATTSSNSTTANFAIYNNSSGNASDIYVWGFHIFRSDLGGMVDNPDRGDSYVPTTSSAVYLPRIGHHVYNGSAWVNEGLLAESESRTNLATHSDMSSATVIGSTRTADNAVSPDGTENAFTITASSTAPAYIRYSGLLTSGQSYAVSVYAKAGTHDIIRIANVSSSTSGQWFDLTNGTLLTSNGANNTATIQEVGNGWYRCTRYFDSVTTGSSDEIFIANSSADGATSAVSGSTFHLYGFQVENNATSSSFIPTSGSSVTRAAETFTIPSANLPWPSPQYIGSELVTNGTFDTDVSGWTVNADGSISLSSNRLRITNATGRGNAYTSFTTEVGKVYSVSLDVPASNNPATAFWLLVGTAPNNSSNLSIFNQPEGSHEYFFVASATTTYLTLYVSNSSAASYTEFDNVSVREINPLSVSIAMDGRVTYADDDSYSTSIFYRWFGDANNYFVHRIDTALTQTGHQVAQQRVNAVDDYSTGNPTNTMFSPDVLVPFDVAVRHGSTFVQVASDGLSPAPNTTPTALPDLSATDLNLAHDYMGTVGAFRVWDRDIADTGLVEATNPSLEPSLSLTFEGTGTNSFIVNDWSE